MISAKDITYMHENELSRMIISAGIQIHKTLGAGLLESAYEECLFYELSGLGLYVERQKILPLVYKDIKLEAGYRIDLMVENKLIIEVKSIESLSNLHMAQLLTYLRLSNCKLGLLMNFNSVLFKDGVKRIINGSL